MRSALLTALPNHDLTNLLFERLGRQHFYGFNSLRGLAHLDQIQMDMAIDSLHSANARTFTNALYASKLDRRIQAFAIGSDKSIYLRRPEITMRCLVFIMSCATAESVRSVPCEMIFRRPEPFVCGQKQFLPVHFGKWFLVWA